MGKGLAYGEPLTVVIITARNTNRERRKPASIRGCFMQHISVRNGTLGVLAQGKGTPILFVHGFPLTHSMWHSQVKAFSPSHRVIAPRFA